MQTKALADGLIELARLQAAGPGGRESVVAALRATLAAVDGVEGSNAGREAKLSQAGWRALFEMANTLTMVGEHAEALAEDLNAHLLSARRQ